MSISPAKPLSNTTTKFTFELNKIFTMFWAVLDWNITTIWAYQLFCFKRTSCILRLVHRCHTIFSASKVRTFAFETHKVGVNDHSVIFRLSEVNWSLFCKFRIRFLKFLKFESIQRHCLYSFIESLILNWVFIELAILSYCYPLLT